MNTPELLGKDLKKEWNTFEQPNFQVFGKWELMACMSAMETEKLSNLIFHETMAE